MSNSDLVDIEGTTLMADDRTAIISDCGKYRYRLSRRLGPEGKAAVFIMLNPSTADATKDDPTIRRCMGFARSWQCGELIVVNLFAVRATDPKDMKAASDPIGPENHRHVTEAADYALHGWPEPGPVICAWGTHGSYLEQDEAVLGWLERENIPVQALHITKHGFPAHPLYLPTSSTLKLYLGRAL